MKTNDFIIAYDIASLKRLKKMAKLLESVAIRVQFSIFLYSNATKEEIKNLSSKIMEIIDVNSDDVRIYKIDIERSIHLKSGMDLKNPTIYIGDRC